MPSSSSLRSSSSSDNKLSTQVDDENTPLLATTAQGPITEPVEASLATGNGVYADEDEDVPLPTAQIFLLCFARLVEPVAFFTILPYINQMVEETGGIDPDDVGFYSGLIESLFSVTQMCVMISWGKAADKFGRKPVLAFSLFGMAIASALFGMSRTLWQMILFRCIAGVFAGTLVTIRAMITENSTKKTAARAFSYFAFAGNLGIFVGTFIGGTLESPAKKFPSTFGRVQFFHDYPYAFPGFIISLLSLITAILTAVFIKETLHLHKGKKSDKPPMSTWEIINAPGVRPVLAINAHVIFLAFAYTAVNPVFMYTAIDHGGAGFSPGFIALFLGISGAAQAVWLLGVFPPLQHRFGIGFIFRLCAAAWPFFFTVSPISNILLRHDLRVAFWILAPTALVIGSGVAMAFISCQLAINAIAPSHETLGELNAINLAMQAGLRAVVPAISTSVFAIGVKHQIAGGQFFWILLIIIASGLYPLINYLPEKADARPKPQQEDSEQA